MSSRKYYVVEIVETVVHQIPVRAKDSDQAERKAEDIWTTKVAPGTDPYFQSSDWDFGRTRKGRVGK
ncbi:hypothetical protein AB0L74_10170 [Streptomyces sp. NPDC052020]|uniref:hypothetical protein n=1 Tax=Streptomyces sp. NPDC052020 TaxID=3155677 RepID=UPI0034394CC4